MTNYVLLDFLNIGGSEFMMIAVAILLLFGGKKLPELARGLGRGIREFNDASEGVKREIHRNINAVTSDLTDKEEEEIKKNHLHPEEEQSSGTSSYAEQEYSRKVQEEYSGQPQTERFVPADQLEAERVVAERLAQTDRIAPEREQTQTTDNAASDLSAENKDNTDDSDEKSLKDSYA